MLDEKSNGRAVVGDGFDDPHDVTDLQIAFGSASELMPAYNDIPDEFRRGHGDARQWTKLQAAWFFSGISKDAVVYRGDVSAEKAWRHLKAIQGSWEPSHEHKQAAVAWLMSRWFKAVA